MSSNSAARQFATTNPPDKSAQFVDLLHPAAASPGSFLHGLVIAPSMACLAAANVRGAGTAAIVGQGP